MPRVQIQSVRLVRDRTVSYDAQGQINAPEKAAAIFGAVIGEMVTEHFAVIALDGKLRPLGLHICGIGTENRASVAVSQVLRYVLLTGARRFIVGHNHPSGDPTPSKEDRELTSYIDKAAMYTGLELVDHVIVAPGGGWQGIK